MSLDSYQQAHTYLGNSKNILIILGHNEIEDTFSSAVALARALTGYKKEVTLFTSGTIPENFYFLKSEYAPKQSIASSQDVDIWLDTQKNPIQQIRQGLRGNQLHIRITPKPGTTITEQDIQIRFAKFTYDLIITLGLDDLNSLGDEFERNASFFFETPIINIDKNSSNERYGQVNIIETTLSSCAEITAALLHKWDAGLLTRAIATPLLAGIIAVTNNFQNSRTKPSTLYEAAHLMSREADQQEIIKYLFKIKPFEFLKLWGIAMSKLQYRDDVKLSWFTLTNEDFSESGATPQVIPAILTELKNNFGDARSFVIFWEDPAPQQGSGQATASFALLHTLYDEQLTALSRSLGGKRLGDNLLFRVSRDRSDAHEKFLTTVSYALKQIELQ